MPFTLREFTAVLLFAATVVGGATAWSVLTAALSFLMVAGMLAVGTVLGWILWAYRRTWLALAAGVGVLGLAFAVAGQPLDLNW